MRYNKSLKRRGAEVMIQPAMAIWRNLQDVAKDVAKLALGYRHRKRKLELTAGEDY